MRSFLRRAGLFLLPVVLTAALFLGMLAAAGEFTAVDAYADDYAREWRNDGFISAQNYNTVLFEPAYINGAAARYQQLVPMRRSQQLLVLGTSRSMQFNGYEFPRASFYNAGGAVSMLGHIRPYLQALPASSRPDTLLLCLDQFFFNASWDTVSETGYAFAPTPAQPDVQDAFFRMMRDSTYGKINPVRIFGADAQTVGVSARCRGSGFRRDGSYSYGAMALQPDLTFAAESKAAAEGSGRFLYAQKPNRAAVRELEKLLAYCQEQHIRVVAYLPPYAPSLWAQMQQTGGYNYIAVLRQSLGEVCAAHGAELYDFTDMGALAADEEFYDGYHAGDRVYARMVLEMLRQGSCLGEYTDEKTVAALLEQPCDNPRLLACTQP